MDEILMILLKAIISVCIALCMRYVLPYLKTKLQGLIDEETYKAILKEVKSVQQDIHFDNGATKKMEVIQRVTAWANIHGITVTEKQLSDLIESAVWEIKNNNFAK